MEINPEEHPPEKKEAPEVKTPERPLECSGCKKDITVRYTEMESGNIHETAMCNDCPELQKKLKGMAHTHTNTESGVKTGLACGDCGTTLESIRVGHPMGCGHCYEIFGDTVVYELYGMGKLPTNIDIESQIKTLHKGRSPGEITEINPSLRLITLNEALDETLKKEDYEQAAMLRDQIKELTGNIEPEEVESPDDNK